MIHLVTYIRIVFLVGAYLGKQYLLFLGNSNFFFNFLLRPKSTDINVFLQVWLHKQYATYFFVDKPKIILDLGANIGLSSLFFVSQFPDSQIYSFEPERNNYQQLIINCKKHVNIHPFQYALGPKNGFLYLKNPNSGEWGYQFSEMNINNEKVTCKTIFSIFDLIGTSRIDILKIDIEGAENFLFSNKSSTDWLKNVRIIIIETHDKIASNSTKFFFQAIDCLNYEAYIKGECIFVHNKDFYNA